MGGGITEIVGSSPKSFSDAVRNAVRAAAETVRRIRGVEVISSDADVDEDHNPRVRRYLRRRGITARIARIGRDSSQRLGRHRWVVERTIGWLLSCKRPALRYDRTATTITALARLAITLICARRLAPG